MEENGWIVATIGSIISGIVAYVTAKANTKPNIERENANHTQLLFNQYKTSIESLQSQIADMQNKIDEIKKEYEAEIKIYRDAVYMLEGEARRLKDDNKDKDEELEELRNKIDASNVEELTNKEMD